MSEKEKNFGKLLIKYGYAPPQTEDEVRAFENNFKKTYQKPKEWPSIDDILEGKFSSENTVSKIKSENKSVKNLAMAAREGKGISEDLKKKMKEDRESAKKK